MDPISDALIMAAAVCSLGQVDSNPMDKHARALVEEGYLWLEEHAPDRSGRTAIPIYRLTPKGFEYAKARLAEEGVAI